MLAANLPVCQYAGMPGQSNSSIANSNLNNNSSSNASTNCNSSIICNSNNPINNNLTASISSNNSHNLLVGSSVNTSNSQNNTNISNIINNNSNSNVLINSSCGSSNSNIIIGNNGGLALDHHIGGLVGGGTSTAAAKNQLEQLNTMREALFSQDGWGCQHVNQDTNWEVPSSPEPTNKDPSGPPMWKPNVNNGTDLWESNLRNGGQPTTQPVQKTPWGHTPSTNLGGTWGEDDDCTDASNVWTGGPAGPSAVVGVSGVTSGSGASGPSNGPQWGQGVGVSGAGVQAAVAAPSSIPGVAPGGNANAGGVNLSGTPGAGGASGAGNGWGDPRVGGMGGGGPLDMRSVDPRDPMRAASAGDPRELRMLDPRDPIRGDPRGISGRLNGTSEMWGQHHPIAQHQMPGLNKMGVGGPNVGGVGTVGGAPGAAGLTGPSSVGGLNASGNVVGSQWGAPPQTVVGAQKDMVGSMAPKPPVSGSGWEEPSPPPQRRNMPNYDDGTSLWGQQTRVPGGVGGGGGSHWKDISDPLNPRNHLMRTAMGGQNTNVANLGGAGGGSSVNSAAAGASGVGAAVNPNNPMGVGAVGPPGSRLVSAINGPGGIVGGPHKDNGMWPHPAGPPNVPTTNVGGNRNAGSWGDVENHNVIGGAASVSGNGAGNWGDEKSNQAVSNMGQAGNSWSEPANASAWNKSNQAKLAGATNSTGWGAGVSNAGSGANDSNDLNPNDWTTAAHNTIMSKAQQQQKLGGGATVNIGGINSDLIKQSKQYRMLVETGFKKEDVERSLIATNMNYDEATEMLRSNLTAVNAGVGVGMDNWRRHDDNLSSYVDHNVTVTAAGGSFPGRYTTGATQPALSFPPNNLLNSMGGGSVGASGGNNPQLNALNSMQPLQVQKYLNQGQHNVGAGGPQSVNAVAFGQGSNVSAVNSAAVNAAAVNAAAVSNSTNQPSTQQLRMLVQQIQLAVHSGYLSSQILNQPLAPTTLLLLNQLLSNIKHLQGAQQSLARSGNNGNTLLAVAKYKQQIQNLQNQINAQQAIYIKQQQALQPNPHPAATHINNTNNEYLRSHDAISAMQGNFSEMNLNKPGGYQGAPNQQSRLNQWKLPVLDKDITTDSTDFSRAPGATKQGGLNTNGSNMGPLGLQGDGTWSTGRNINDGWPDPSNDSENKDWSVGQPSTATAYTDLVQEFEPGKPWKGSQIKSIEDDPSITPGSVARSPLSINPTPKDADIFSNAVSKNSPTDLPSLGLTSSSTWSFNPSSSNQNFPSWSDNTQQEIWSSMNKTSRGPPPGLGSNKTGGVGVPNVINPGNANGWLGGGRTGGWSGTNSNWNSNWLLLKNLTAQIDSSTLRTLCMQHGPLLNFHLYLNQGIALCKYATREEASKAQMTLNNCFLANTTIIAESPSENEVHSILHHLPQQNTNNTATQQQQQAQQQGQASSHNNPAALNNTGVGGGGGGSSNTNANNVNSVNNASGSQNPSTSCGNVNGMNQQPNNPANNASNINSANNSSNNANSGQNGNQPSNHNSHPNASTQNPSNVVTNNSNAVSNNPSNANTNTGWRSTGQQPQQTQNSQTRPSGGRDDFEFISKYVCSIVDD